MKNTDSSNMSAAEAPSNFQKYGTSNPVMRKVISRFLNRVSDHVQMLQPRSLVDLGCGEGFTVMSLRQRGLEFDYLGLELNPDALALARVNVPNERFEQADILQRDPGNEQADVAICLEVLEHLEDPGEALAQIAKWTNGSALLSVPWEPWFRMGNFCRGKYVSRWGNHPEHIQQFGVGSFAGLVAQHFESVEIDTCFPWIIAIASNAETTIDHAGGWS